MGQQMCCVLPNLYQGNIRDSKDNTQLNQYGITHIVSIHGSAQPVNDGRTYLCIPIDDTPTKNLKEFFHKTNKFIHNARMNDGTVLVHCIAGVSRSTTVVVAYMMTASDMRFEDCLTCVQQYRSCAQPNWGFRKQLIEFEKNSKKDSQQLIEFDQYSYMALKDSHHIRNACKEAAKSLEANRSASYDGIQSRKDIMREHRKGYKPAAAAATTTNNSCWTIPTHDEETSCDDNQEDHNTLKSRSRESQSLDDFNILDSHRMKDISRPSPILHGGSSEHLIPEVRYISRSKSQLFTSERD